MRMDLGGFEPYTRQAALLPERIQAFGIEWEVGHRGLVHGGESQQCTNRS